MESSYRASFERMDSARWHGLLQRFTEANLFQSWAYGAVRWGEGQLSHCVLTRDGDVVAMAQLRIVSLPVLGGIAYLTSGPVWKRGDTESDLANLRQLLIELKREYAGRRGLLLRIIPHEFGESTPQHAAYLAAGFKWMASGKMTALVDLTPPEPDRRKNLASRWRTDLNQSERNELTIDEGTGDDLFTQFAQIYQEMHAHKQFDEAWDIEDFRKIQHVLPETHKMTYMICRDASGPLAGAVTSVFGQFGLAILWATNQAGRDKKAAFRLQWHVANWLNGKGCTVFDTGGVDQAENPGSYRFKMGLAGKNAEPAPFIGQYEACRNPLSLATVRGGDFARPLLRRLTGR